MAAGALLLLLSFGPSAAPPVAADDGGFDDTPQTPGQLGAPVLTDGGAAFDGTYVDGRLPEEGAVVANFTRQGVRLFDSVTVSGYGRALTRVEGGRIEAEGPGVKLEVVDSPAGYLEVEAGPGRTVAFAPSGGVAFVAGEGGTVAVHGPGVEGLLFAVCEGRAMALVGGRAELSTGAQDCEAFFRAATQADVVPFADLDDAFSNGDLGAEVSVGAQGPEAPVTRVTYGPVEVNVTLDNGRLSVAVQGTSPEGKSVLVLLPRSSVDAAAAVNATYDGRAVARASSAADAFNASDDGGVPEYYLTSSGNLTAVVLTVPHFSVHQFVLAGAPAAVLLAPTNPGVPLGQAAVPLLLGTLVAAGAAAALWRKPED